jgi:hypothetical protein
VCIRGRHCPNKCMMRTYTNADTLADHTHAYTLERHTHTHVFIQVHVCLRTNIPNTCLGVCVRTTYTPHTHLIPSTRMMHHTYSLNKCMRHSHSQHTPCIHTYIMHTHIHHTSCILDSIHQMHSLLYCQTFSYFRHTKVNCQTFSYFRHTKVKCTLPQIPGHHDPGK